MSSVLRNQDNPPTISEVSSTTKENTDNSNSKQEEKEKEKEKEISSTIESPTFVDDEEDNNPFSHHGEGLTSFMTANSFNEGSNTKSDKGTTKKIITAAATTTEVTTTMTTMTILYYYIIH